MEEDILTRFSSGTFEGFGEVCLPGVWQAHAVRHSSCWRECKDIIRRAIYLTFNPLNFPGVDRNPAYSPIRSDGKTKDTIS